LKYRLVLSDVDSTLIEQEVIDLLAQRSGHGQEVAKITRAAMAGELDFQSALIERVGCLKGISLEVLKEVASEIKLSAGALELRAFCREKGIAFGAVTGGFYQILNQIPFFCELDFLRANSLQVEAGHLTGQVEGNIVDQRAKAHFLAEFAEQRMVPMASCVAIGDGANDLEMIKQAGLGISFRGKEILNSAADISISESLAEVIPLLN